MGNSPGLGIALSRTSSAGSYVSLNRAYSDPLDSRYELREGETIDAVGIAGRPIYIIRGPDGRPTGVRKIAVTVNDRPGYFSATQQEANMYEQIRNENPDDWSAHLLPYREKHGNRSTVIIDFDWVDGMDVGAYLEANPRAATIVFDKIAQQLRWLTEKGYIHGDIKTGNFFRTVDGRILILDLGLTQKRINVISARNEKNAFIDMIRPFVKQKVVQRLEEQPLTLALADFYLMAARRIRKSVRTTRTNRP